MGVCICVWTCGADPRPNGLWSCYCPALACPRAPDASEATTSARGAARPQEEVRVAPASVHCLLFQAERECVIAGCDDGAMRLHFLDGRVPMANDAPLPTLLLGAGRRAAWGASDYWRLQGAHGAFGRRPATGWRSLHDGRPPQPRARAQATRAP